MTTQLTIKALRVLRGVTQTTLAVAAGTSQPIISMIETGEYTPPDALLWKLAKVLQVEDPKTLLEPFSEETTVE